MDDPISNQYIHENHGLFAISKPWVSLSRMANSFKKKLAEEHFRNLVKSPSIPINDPLFQKTLP